MILSLLKKKRNQFSFDYDPAKSTIFKLKFGLDLKVASFFHTGSRIICNPAPSNTDEDWIVLVKRDLDRGLKDILRWQDWYADSGYLPEPNDPEAFLSFRKGNLNLIFTNKPEYYLKFCAATLLAKELNLTEKEDRLNLFRIVKGMAKGEERGILPKTLLP